MRFWYFVQLYTLLFILIIGTSRDLYYIEIEDFIIDVFDPMARRLVDIFTAFQHYKLAD